MSVFVHTHVKKMSVQGGWGCQTMAKLVVEKS